MNYPPYQEIRNAYWQYLTEFIDNHGHMNRSHTFDNFKKFIERENIVVDIPLVDLWNWYFV